MISTDQRAEGIFASTAPRYWEKGLHAVPLQAKGKGPKGYFVRGWQDFSTELLPESKKLEWLREGQYGNIGVIAGEYANICFIDVDTTDPAAQKVIQDLLPPSPWVRTGKKGFMLAYRCSPELARDPEGRAEKNFQLQGKDKQGNLIEGNLIEFKWNGTQVVVPPSIHPETNEPYTANCNLYDVFDQLPWIFPDIRQTFIAAFAAAGIEVVSKESTKLNTAQKVAKGARDNSMTAHAGLMARTVLRGERTVQEAWDEMKEWCDTQLYHDPHDPIDIDKGMNQFISFLERDVKNKDSNRSLPLGWDGGMRPELKAELDKIFNPEDQEWTLKALQEYTYNAPRNDQHQKLESYNYIIARAAKSPNIYDNPANLSAFSYMAYHGLGLKDIGMTLSEVKKAVSRSKFGALEGKNHTEIARMVIEHLELFGQLRYENMQFWQWKGSHWTRLEEWFLLKTIAEEFGDAKAASKQSDHTQIVKLMRSLLPQGLKESDEAGINFLNGYLTVDLALKPHDPKYGATYTMQYSYEPDTECPPRFKEHMRLCWEGDEDYEDKVRALRQAICTTLFGTAYTMQRAFLLKGVSQTGKSTIREVVEGLVPNEAVSHVPPESWSDKFMPASMANKILNACGETDNARYISGKHFKEIIEGSRISAQFKGTNIFEFRPTCAQWFSGNHLPRTRDTSDGFNRRFLILNFTRKVTSDKRIFNYHDYILEEEAGKIASWAAQEIVNFRGAGVDYCIPLSSIAEVEQMATTNNPVRFFLRESSKIALDMHKPRSTGTTEGLMTSSRVSENQLFMEFTTFCGEHGARAVGLKEFRQLMQELAPDFGLQFNESYSKQGQREFLYTGITLAKGFTASGLASRGH